MTLKLPACIFLLFNLAVAGTYAQAPNISYSSPESYIVGTPISPLSPVNTGGAVATQTTATLATGFYIIRGLAVDKSGNIYVAENGNNDIEEIPVGSSTPVIIGSGFDGPAGVAVDTAGNVYVTDNTNKAIKKIPAGNGAVVTISTSFASPYGIAIDAAGNLYVSDAVNNNVTKISAVGGSATVIGTGFNIPTGVAVDASGNVYVADRGSNTVKEIPVAGGSIITVTSGLDAPNGVAVDNAGNIFIDDDDNNEIKRVPAGGGSPVIVGSGFSLPTGVAVDASDNVYVSDDGNNAVKQITTGGYFINPALPAGLSISNTTGIISGTPTASSPSTKYVITGYNSGGGGMATVNITVNPVPKPTVSYNSPNIYDKQQAITPLTPVTSGVAPAGDNSPVTLASSLSNLTGVAVDASGNVYAVENGANIIGKIPAGGGTAVSIGSGFNAPTGVAVDATGNVYVADNGNNAVKEIPVGGGAIITLGSGFSGPYGLAVDASGNIYVGDANNNAVKKIPAGSNTPVIIGTGFNHPTGVAVDAAGNVYVADRANNAIKKILAVGGSTVTLSAGSGNPNGVAVDNEGNVYFADTDVASITEIPAAGGANIAVGTGFIAPTAVAVDASNNVYVADNGHGDITEIKPSGGFYINPALPAGLNFSSSTGIISGTPTVNSPATNYTVTAYNIGGSTTAVVNISVITPDAGLANLAVSNGVLSPAFATSTTSYTVAEPNATTSITVTPTTSNATYTVDVNGTSVTSGSPSFSIPLTVGANTVSITVTSQSATTLGIYTIDVNRAPSSNANLAGLVVSSGALTPAFAASTTNYTDDVPYNTTSITLTPTVADATATVNVNGSTVNSGATSSAISLNPGSNTISTVVTAQDGITTETYTITVNRIESTNDSLANLTVSAGTLSPIFAAGNTLYRVTVPNSTSSITITPTLADLTATVAVNSSPVASGSPSPSIPLTVGADTIYTLVRAQNTSYVDLITIIVTRAPLSNDNLANLVLSAGTLTPAFSSGTTSYSTSVGNATTSIMVTPTAGSAGSTITVNGTAVTSGSASGAIALTVGANTISTVVTNGTATQTYTVTVTRVPSSNAKLSFLGLSQVVLSPSFSNATTSYTASVANTLTSTNVLPIVVDPTATIKVNGVAVASGASTPVSLNVGANVINTVVTAQDGVTMITYAVTVTRAPSSVATLSNLTLSSGTLSPAFGSSKTSYTATVGNAVTSITETPTTTANTETITVNGAAVTSGSPSGAIALSIGTNTITTVVTAQDGMTTDTYTVTVTRAPSSNAKLSFLGLSQVVLSPAFSNATTSYTASVANTITSTNVLPIVVQANATIAVNGVAVASGASTPVSLNAGNNVINTVVTAQDGVTTITYTVTVTRAPSTVATLSNLTLSSGTLSPAFSSSKTSYTASVGNAVTSIAVTPTASSAAAMITVNGTAVTSGGTSGAFALSVGANTITTIVTAQNGTTTQTYTLTVTRATSSNAKLSFLGLSKVVLSPAFVTATTSYTASVANTLTSTNVLPITVDPTATIEVNGVAVASDASTPVSLNVGANVINTVVTAQDGITQVTYTVTVTRAALSGAYVIYQPVGVEKPTDSPQLADDGIVVHQGVSPNGDGIDDYLQIDNIANYPENKLTIINRSGMLIFETKGYDNSSRMFDGHSNKNGQMQLPGTYFYSLDYTANGIIKHKTGFIVLKY